MKLLYGLWAMLTLTLSAPLAGPLIQDRPPDHFSAAPQQTPESASSALRPFVQVSAFVAEADPAPSPIVPDGPVPPKPPPPPPPDPTVPLPLDASQIYVIRSQTPIAIRCSPKGLVKISRDEGPIKIRGKVIAGPSKPGANDASDGSTIVTRTFGEPYVYSVECGVGSGLCDLLIITDLLDETKDIRRTLNVGGAPVPPGPGPNPPDPPSPDPFQAGDSMLRVLIVYDDATRKALPVGQLAALQDDGWRKYVEGKGGTWRCFDKDTDVTNAPAAFKKAFGKTRTELPYLYVGNGRAGFAGPMPKTLGDLNTLLAKFGG